MVHKVVKHVEKEVRGVAYHVSELRDLVLHGNLSLIHI